jgi:transposase-like protein
MKHWLQAIYLMAASKKGMSANQLHRTLGVTLKTAWFIGHRIREAMRQGALTPFGSHGGIVEVDETFIGREEGKAKKRSFHHKQKVLSLLDRENREARSMVIDNVTSAEIFPILEENIAREARIMTDDGTHYTSLGIYFRRHELVKHRNREYVSPLNRAVHVNTLEGYFSIFKRGMKGIYQHCKKQHLHRYLAEFDFRYNHRIAKGVNDVSRADALLKGATGKRLTYRTTH